MTYYRDLDDDGFGDPSDSIIAGSTAPDGYVIDNTDCDDSDPSVFPGANDTPNDGIDSDCDGND